MSELKVYTMEEVSKHASQNDCWIVIEGRVLDVQSFLMEHPGGEDIILDGAGTDMTSGFEDTGHSSDARKQLDKYVIGKVEGGGAPSKKATKSTTVSASAGPSPLEIVALVVVVVAGLVLFMTQK